MAAAADGSAHGLSDNWLRPVQDLAERHADELRALPTPAQRHARLCELNVAAGVHAVARTTVMRSAWAESRDVTVHGWIYRLDDGLLHVITPPVRM